MESEEEQNRSETVPGQTRSPSAPCPAPVPRAGVRRCPAPGLPQPPARPPSQEPLSAHARVSAPRVSPAFGAKIDGGVGRGEDGESKE